MAKDPCSGVSIAFDKLMRLSSSGRIQQPKNHSRESEVLMYSFGFDIFKKCRQEVLDEFSCIHF
jgi:hypothetical protein